MLQPVVMENLELQSELQSLWQSVRGMVPSGRLVILLLLLLCLGLCHSFAMFKLIWLWALLACCFSFVKGIVAFQIQLRRLGPLLSTTVDPVNLRLTLVDRDFDETDYEALLGLDDSINAAKSKGVGAEALDQLPCTVVSSEWLKEALSAPGFVQECAICLEDYGTGETVRTLKCGHVYHQPCIDTWLSHAMVCPICKTTVL